MTTHLLREFYVKRTKKTMATRKSRPGFSYCGVQSDPSMMVALDLVTCQKCIACFRKDIGA